MKSNMMMNFIRSRKKVFFYTVIKVLLAAYLFYLFAINENLGKKMIFIFSGFLVLMSMVPVVLFHQLELKKEKQKNGSNKHISKK